MPKQLARQGSIPAAGRWPPAYPSHGSRKQEIVPDAIGAAINRGGLRQEVRADRTYRRGADALNASLAAIERATADFHDRPAGVRPAAAGGARPAGDWNQRGGPSVAKKATEPPTGLVSAGPTASGQGRGAELERCGCCAGTAWLFRDTSRCLYSSGWRVSGIGGTPPQVATALPRNGVEDAWRANATPAAADDPSPARRSGPGQRAAHVANSHGTRQSHSAGTATQYGHAKPAGA